MLITKRMSKNSAFKSATAYPNRTMAFLLDKISQQQLLLLKLRAALPPALAGHISHCVVNDKTLLIYTKSTSWASVLRFHDQALLDAIAALTQRTVNVLKIKVLLESSSGSSQSAVRKAKVPSQEAIEIIRNQSESVSDDQLQRALIKLATTLKKVSQ